MRIFTTKTLITLGLGALLFMATATPGQAQGKIDNLGLSPSDKRADVFENDPIFETGVEEIYVHFDYTVPSKREIEVTVTAPGGILVFEDKSTYSGSGSASVEVTGASFYRTLAEQTLEMAKDAEEGADLLKKQTVGHDVYLQLVENAGNAMRAASEILETWSLDSAADAALADLIDAIERIEDLVDEDVDFTDSAERKSYADDLLKVAGDARGAAKKLDDLGDDIDTLNIASTDADRETGYLTQVSIQGNLADSIEFWVTDDALPAPTSTDAPAPTKKPLPTSDGTAVRSATSEAGGDDDSGGTDAGSSAGSSLSTSDRRATSTARANNAAIGLETEEAKPTLPIEENEADAADAPPVIDPIAEDTPDDPNAPTPVATWTVEPGAGTDDPNKGPEGPKGGPNIAVLGLGIMALAAIALWLRRRS
jgi:hypothetical protein